MPVVKGAQTLAHHCIYTYIYTHTQLLLLMEAILSVCVVPEMTGEMDGSEGDNKWTKRKTLLMLDSTCFVMFG